MSLNPCDVSDSAESDGTIHNDAVPIPLVLESISNLNLSEPQQCQANSTTGRCLIFNYEEFTSTKRSKLTSRIGSKNDAEHLKHVFKELDFDVQGPYLNYTEQETLNALKRESNVDHTDSRCFVCCFLTHGRSDLERELRTADNWIPLSKILRVFSRSSCPTLEGIPKIFIIQACHDGKKANPSDLNLGEDYLDFLIAESTYPGTPSFRTSDPERAVNNHGSHFIDRICHFLEQFSKELDLLQILTLVNYEMGYFFQSVSRDENNDGKGQMPYIISRLRNKVHFRKSIKPFVSDATKFFDKRFRCKTKKHSLLELQSYNIRSSENVQFLSVINELKEEEEFNAQLQVVSTQLSAYIERNYYCEDLNRNLSKKELLKKMELFVNNDVSSVDCFVCFVIAYYKGESLCASTGKKICKRGIIEKTFGDKLAGIPKVFIFLLCKSDKEIGFKSTIEADGVEKKPISEYADILEVTIKFEETTYLLESTEEFFKILESYKSEDVLSLMTRINHKFVEDYKFYNLEHTDKKMSSFESRSTLTKQLFLP